MFKKIADKFKAVYAALAMALTLGMAQVATAAPLDLTGVSFTDAETGISSGAVLIIGLLAFLTSVYVVIRLFKSNRG